MSNKLTLKERIQLFKINKKARKQIIVRFDTLTNSLNLPTLGQTIHISSKHFKVIEQKRSTHHLSSKDLNKPSYKPQLSEKTEEDILRMKNQIFRERILKSELNNRKNAGIIFKKARQQNNKWYTQECYDFA